MGHFDWNVIIILSLHANFAISYHACLSLYCTHLPDFLFVQVHLGLLSLHIFVIFSPKIPASFVGSFCNNAFAASQFSLLTDLFGFRRVLRFHKVIQLQQVLSLPRLCYMARSVVYNQVSLLSVTGSQTSTNYHSACLNLNFVTGSFVWAVFPLFGDFFDV